MGLKLRAFLVDDEPLALDRLTLLLERTGRVEIFGRASEPEDAVTLMIGEPPDMCFLDIQMPRLTGFDVLACLPSPPAVVFTTAYDQYALEAFAVDSVNNLPKPIDPSLLNRALDKIERLCGPGAAGAMPSFDDLLERIAALLRTNQPVYPERIASRLGKRVRFISVADVTHFVAKDRLCYAIVGGCRSALTRRSPTSSSDSTHAALSACIAAPSWGSRRSKTFGRPRAEA
jgi:two-component system, LytTR family, response regulator